MKQTVVNLRDKIKGSSKVKGHSHWFCSEIGKWVKKRNVTATHLYDSRIHRLHKYGLSSKEWKLINEQKAILQYLQHTLTVDHIRNAFNTGCRSASALLKHLLFIINETIETTAFYDNRLCIYKSQPQIGNNIGCTRQTTRKYLNLLIRSGVIEKLRLSKDKSDRIYFYFINTKVAVESLLHETLPLKYNNKKQDKDSPCGINLSPEFKNMQTAEEYYDLPTITVAQPTPYPAPLNISEVWDMIDIHMPKTPGRIRYLAAAVKYIMHYLNCSLEKAIECLKTIYKRNAERLRSVGKKLTLHFMFSYQNIKLFFEKFKIMPKKDEKKIPLADRRLALRWLPYDIKQKITCEEMLNKYFAWLGHKIEPRETDVEIICKQIIAPNRFYLDKIEQLFPELFDLGYEVVLKCEK